MNETATDTSREIDRWFGSYDADHRHPANVAFHRICIPLILWSVAALLWIAPVPAALGHAGLWAAAATVIVTAFYLRLSRTLAFAMLAVLIVLCILNAVLYDALGPAKLMWLAIAVFVVAWIGQFIGHALEGRRPSFFTDLLYLLIGPAWVMAKVMRKIGVAY